MDNLKVPPKNPLFEAAVLRKVNEIVAAINAGGGGGGGGAAWGGITGTLSSQTDLQNALNAKQDALGIGDVSIDFGAFAYTAKASVADATVTGTTRIMLTLENGSGRDSDELEMAPMTLGVHVVDGVGFDIYANALQGANGQFTVNYMKV